MKFRSSVDPCSCTQWPAPRGRRVSSLCCIETVEPRHLRSDIVYVGQSSDDVVGRILQLAAGHASSPSCTRHWAPRDLRVHESPPDSGGVVRSLPLLTSGCCDDLNRFLSTATDSWEREEVLMRMLLSSVHRVRGWNQASIDCLPSSTEQRDCQ